MSSAMNKSQNQNAPPSNVSFDQPPEVRIIEASCRQASRSTDDFAEWDNVLKEPILIRKGSEIKCLSTFLDAPGIDTDIIQFTRSGSEQDNVHTFLSQMYIVNDGFNNKTCSYDYMSRQGVRVISNTTANTFTVAPTDVFYLRVPDPNNVGSYLGDRCQITSVEEVISATGPTGGTLRSVAITNAGVNYQDGDQVKVASDTVGSDAYFSLKVGPLGEVISVVITEPGDEQATGGGAQTQITASGTGAVFTLTCSGGLIFRSATFGGIIPAGQPNAGDFDDDTGNGQYKPGDICEVWRKATAEVFPGTNTGAKVQLNNVYEGNPGLCKPSTTNWTVKDERPSYFDQGYNYQRVPLYRWCQTYTNGTNFCYGRNFVREYTADDNINYDISKPSIINQNDLNLSAAYLLQNKEDEFVPGFFHKNSDSLVNPGTFKMFRSSHQVVPSSPNSGFVLGRDVTVGSKFLGCGRIDTFANTKDVYLNPNLPRIEENRTTIDYFWGNSFCPGMAVQIDFDLSPDAHPALRTTANMTLIHNNFIRKYGGIFTIGSSEIITEGGQQIRRNYIGPPAKFDSSGNSDLGIYNYENFNKGMVTAVTICNNTGDPDLGLGSNITGTIIACIVDSLSKPDSNYPTPSPTTYVGVWVNTDADGKIAGDVYMLLPETYGSTDWKPGYVLKPAFPGSVGVPAGWNLVGHNATNLRIWIAQTDFSSGSDFESWENLSQAELTFNETVGGNATPVCMTITPVPYYMAGLETFRTGGTELPNVNGVGLQKVHGAQFFDNYNTHYPPTSQNAFINSDTNHAGVTDEYRTTALQCGLYKPTGSIKSQSTSNKSSNIQAHNLNQKLILKDADVSASPDYYALSGLTIGSTGASDIIQATGTIAGGQYPTRQIVFNLTKINATYNTIITPWDLPNQGLLILNEGDANERHLLMGGEMSVGALANGDVSVTIKCKSADTNDNKANAFFIPASAAVPEPFNSFAGLGSNESLLDITGTVSMKWWNNIHTMNQAAEFTLDEANGTGTIAVTSEQNFFGNNDINLVSNKLLTSSSWQNIYDGGISQPELSAYDGGGYYYITNAIGSLQKESVSIKKFFGFSQGFGEFVLQDQSTTANPPGNSSALNYNNRLLDDTNLQADNIVYAYSSQNDITNVYGYEPYYQQKTFTIDRNFVVPSDIASRWNILSHKPTGIVDRDLGHILAPQNQTGLIQNEFVCPIYGSNNIIAPDSNYVKDLVQYPHSSGLLGGHMVGIGFIDDKQEWLNPNLAPYMPKFVGRVKPNVFTAGSTHYKIFLRNAWTFIRNYDPTLGRAVDLVEYKNGGTGQVFIPDRTAINTLSTAASNIGNTSTIGAALNLPVIPNQEKRLLDGKIMSYVNSPDMVVKPDQVPDPNHPHAIPPIQQQPYNPAILPNTAKISELMTNIPNQVAVEPLDGGWEQGVDVPFPSAPKAYPVKFLENNVDNEYATAIAAQYAGTTNLTLAFETTISAFTFQFFYQPFTSPFVDGSGGDQSTRIFYGNRKRGIYNHDAFSGVVVWNYCRPNYPRGTFSYEDIVLPAVSQPVEYPNGINPFRDCAVIGNRFLNKLGFADEDIGINKASIIGYGLNTVGNNLGFSAVPYSTSILGDTSAKIIDSLNLITIGTNFTDVDSSDAILSAIDAPENTAGLFANQVVQKPLMGQKPNLKITKLNGDYIFYPYSLDNSTDTFNVNKGSIRFDNATDAFASMGGGISKNQGRGVGLPNTQGSTNIIDQKSIPVTMNADCNLYLSFTVETPSNFIAASKLPIKMNHGHLIVLSSLIEEPNFIMSKAQAVNGISVVSKAYITADFILSTGFLSFYAKEDRIISNITTKIVNTAFESPTVLGNNSTVIYQITDYSPKPLERPMQISEIQNNDYQMMEMVNEHMSSMTEGRSSALDNLQSELYNLGVAVATEEGGVKNDNIISQMRAQIDSVGLRGMSTAQRNQFFQTPAGQAFVANSVDAQQVMGNVRRLENEFQDFQDGIINEGDYNVARQEVAERSRQVAEAIRNRSAQHTGILNQITEDRSRNELDRSEFIHARRRPPGGDARNISGARRQALNARRAEAGRMREQFEEQGVSLGEPTIRNSIRDRAEPPEEGRAEPPEEE